MKNKVIALKRYAHLSCIVVSPIIWTPSFLARFSKRWANYAATEREVIIEGIKVYYPRYVRPSGAWFTPFEGISMFISVLCLVVRRKIYSDVRFILGGNMSEDALAAFLLAKLLGKRCGSLAIGSDMNLYPFKSRLLMWLTHFLLKNLDVVFCNGSGFLRFVQDKYGQYSSLRQNYLGVDITKFCFHQRKPELKLRGLFVGDIVQKKGIFELARAVQELSSQFNFEISIVGSGSSSDQQKLDRIVQACPKSLRFYGRVDQVTLYNLFKDSDFFIFPTYSEGCATVLMEAAASGLPILTTNIPQNFDFVGEGTIQFPPGDSVAIREAIMNFLTIEPELRLNMAMASRKLAETRFSDQVAAVEFLRICTSELNLLS